MSESFVVKCSEKSKRKAAEIRDHLLSAADQLDKHIINVNFLKVLGAGVGGFGGGLVTGGIILAPFTGGLSLMVSIGGGLMGTAGGLAASGARIAAHFIEKSKLQELSAKWDEWCQFILEDVEQNSSQSHKDRIGDQLKEYKVTVALVESWVLHGLNLGNFFTETRDLHRIKKSSAADFLRSYARKLDVFVQTGSLELPETS